MTRKHNRYLKLLSYYDSEGNRIKEDGWEKKFADRCKATHKKNGSWAGRVPKRHFYLRSPTGEIVYTIRLSQFAREMGLSKTRIYGVVNGKKGCDSYRGWTRPSEAQVAEARANGALITKFYEQPIPPPNQQSH